MSINNLQAQPISNSGIKFTSSDLDNGILLSQQAIQNLNNYIEPKPLLKPIEPQKTEEEISLGFYFSQTDKKNIQLVFSKDELGEFQITLSDNNGKTVLEQKADISITSLQVKLSLNATLPKGMYYLKAKHTASGHIYLKKLDVN
ncbi:MAG: hypothetical protein IPI46_11565 [Bacteroidetes bacterium]|nr:hypothetical protein [Bacteroidota bacterium]